MAKKCDLTGVGIMTGNNVSKSNRRTRRDFLPNLKGVTLKSEALGANIALKVKASVLRTINKYGDLDSFLVNYRFCKLTDKALGLRKKIEKALIGKGEFENVKTTNKKSNTTRAEKSARLEKKKEKTKNAKIETKAK